MLRSKVTNASGSDLGLLKRDKKLQQRYGLWAVGIRAKYGSLGVCLSHNHRYCMEFYRSIVNYLKTYRLQWGQPDSRSLLLSALPGLTVPKDASDEDAESGLQAEPELPPNIPPYFMADTPPGLISIIMNDWPYSGMYVIDCHGALFIHSASQQSRLRSSTLSYGHVYPPFQPISHRPSSHA